MKAVLETHSIEGIPALTISPADAADCPVILFIPGYTGTKKAGLDLGYKLVKRGVFFISFDPLYHGERYQPQLYHSAEPEFGGIYPPDTGMDTLYTMFRVIDQCREDAKTLLAHFDSDPRANTSSCGVVGFSMGGYASFLLFADLPQVKAGVPMIGIPSFERRWTDVLDECAFSNPEWAAALEQTNAQTRERTAFVRQIDPATRLPDAAPKPLLIINNDFDSDQPKHYSIELYRDLQLSYQEKPENLRLGIYPAGHKVTPQMEDDAVEWFSRHLLG